MGRAFERLRLAQREMRTAKCHDCAQAQRRQTGQDT
jgi:hypothetical protein